MNFSEVHHFLTAVRQQCHNEQSSPDHLCFFFSGFLFGDERCASKLSRNRKNSEASIRRFDLNLPVHTARIRDAFWPKLGRLFGISGEPSLLLNPSSSPVSPPATRRNSARFYRAMRRKEVTSSSDYSCTWSYLGSCRGWSTSVRCLICTVILRFWHFSLLYCFLLGHFNSVKLTLPVKFNIFGSMHLIRLISCAIFKAEA